MGWLVGELLSQQFFELEEAHLTEMLETPLLGSRISTLVEDDSRLQATQPPTLSVVIPTKNEAANIEPLVDALMEAVAAFRTEVIFVDDSDDDTSDRIRDVAMVWTHRRLRDPSARTHRPAAHRWSVRCGDRRHRRGASRDGCA